MINTRIQHNPQFVQSIDMEPLIWRKCTHAGRADFKSYVDFRLHQRVPQLHHQPPAIAEGLTAAFNKPQKCQTTKILLVVLPRYMTVPS